MTKPTLVVRLHLKTFVDVSLLDKPALAPLRRLLVNYPLFISVEDNVVTLTLGSLIRDGLLKLDEAFFPELMRALNRSPIRQVWVEAPTESTGHRLTDHRRRFVTYLIDTLHNPGITSLLVANVPVHHIHDQLVRYLKSGRSHGLHFLKIFGHGQPTDYWARWMTASIIPVNSTLLQITVCNCASPTEDEGCGCPQTFRGHTATSHVLLANAQKMLIRNQAAAKFFVQTFTTSKLFAPHTPTPPGAASPTVGNSSSPVAPSSPSTVNGVLPLEVIRLVLSYLEVEPITTTPTEAQIRALLASFAIQPAPYTDTVIFIVAPPAEAPNARAGPPARPAEVASPPTGPPAPAAPPAPAPMSPLTDDEMNRIIKYALSRRGLGRMLEALCFGDDEEDYNRDVNRHEFFKQILAAPMANLRGFEPFESINYDAA
ncbi:uncharacterized protein LOC62_04G006448 [Vanrija pseudolonga]|uniref:Uncharacterized protein n=1 Tax=Vanrija pseudolonga TaxID=143232 RepID=A0AAF0YDS3_9TREE|nr:hypothetical protein LOC62_04G006448 [Vanrija pseudolonga]